MEKVIDGSAPKEAVIVPKPGNSKHVGVLYIYDYVSRYIYGSPIHTNECRFLTYYCNGDTIVLKYDTGYAPYSSDAPSGYWIGDMLCMYCRNSILTYNRSILVNSDGTYVVKKSNTDSFPLSNSYYFTSTGKIYDYLDNEISTSSITFGNMVVVINGNVFLKSTSQIRQYSYDDSSNTLELSTSYSTNENNIMVQENYSIMYFMTNSTTYSYLLDDGQGKIIKLTIGNDEYYDTSSSSTNTSEILFGKKVFNSTGKIVGTMPNNGELNYLPTTVNQNIPLGYTSGGIVQGDANLTSENIKSGISIFNINGSFTSDGDIQPGDVKYGKVAYSQSNRIVGTIQYQDKEDEIIVSGDYSYTPDPGYDALTSVNIRVNISGGEINLATTNQTVEDMQQKAAIYNSFNYLTIAENVNSVSNMWTNSGYGLVPNINMANILDASNMLSNCENLMYIPNFYMPNILNTSYMFYNCPNLIGGYNSSIGQVDITLFNLSIGNSVDTSAMFMDCTSLTNIPDYNLQSTENIVNMFSGCIRLHNININNLPNCQNSYGLLQNCQNLVSANIYEMHSAINTVNSFANCYNITNIHITNLESPVDMAEMFYDCHNLVTLTDLNSWNTINTTNMENMFYNCVNLSLETYENIANMVPNANQLTNQYLSNMGLNTSQFQVNALLILEGKGYIDAESFKGNYVIEYS